MRKSFWQGISPVFSFFTDHRFRMIRFEMVLTLLVMVTCVLAQGVDSSSTRSIPTAASIGQVKAAATTTPATQAPAPASTTAPAPTVAVATPVIPASCTPSTTYTSTPAALPLGSYGDGLATVRDASYYHVSGSSRSDSSRN